MSKTHMILHPDLKFRIAYLKLHPVRSTRHGIVASRFTSIEQLESGVEFLTKYPHTFCNELVNEVITTDNIDNVTCKICLKSFKKHQKDVDELKEHGLL